MRVAEAKLAERHPRGGIDPRTGKTRIRINPVRSRVVRSAESLKLRRDTVIPLKDFMGTLPIGATQVLAQVDAEKKLGGVAAAFQQRAESGGSRGRAAIMEVAELRGRRDFVKALAVIREFMGIGLRKGGGIGLDTLIKAKSVRVPHSAAKVEIQAPKKKRKKYPFQGFIDFQGLKIDVENKAGSRRKGVAEDGTQWDVAMHYHYGEIRGTKGTDGDLLDVYVGPNADSPLVVVVHQQDPKTKAYDEDKVMLGWDTVRAAVKAYKRQYDAPGFYQGHTALNIGAFWRWCHDTRNRGQKVGKGWVECSKLEYAGHAAEVWKGAGHKYIKRVRKPGGGYRYYYRVTHGSGVGHEEHMAVGSAFRHQGGHYHIVSARGDKVRIKHDESGKTMSVTRKMLGSMLRVEHAEAIKEHRERLKDDLEAAQKYGTRKQLARLLGEAEKWGVRTEITIPPDEPKGAVENLDEVAPTLEEPEKPAKKPGDFTPEQLEALALFGRLAKKLAEDVAKQKEAETKEETPAEKNKTRKRLAKAKAQAKKDIDEGSKPVVHEEVGEHVFGARRDYATSRRDQIKSDKKRVKKSEIFGSYTIHDHVANGGTIGAWHAKNWLVGRVASTVKAEDVDAYLDAATLVSKTLERCKTIDDIKVAVQELGDWGRITMPPSDKVAYIHNGEIHKKVGVQWTWNTGLVHIFETPTATRQKRALGKNFQKVLEGDSPGYRKALGQGARMDRQGTAVEDYVRSHAKKKGFRFTLGAARTVPEPRRVGGPEVDGITKGRVTGDKVLEHFGLKNLDYGNWATNEQRDTHLRGAAGAFTDLADIMGVRPAALGRGGELALGFGSRGRKGGVAHYESDTKAINLTKFRGGGSLAHEWGHYLDNAISGGAAGQFASEHKGPGRELPAASREAMVDLQRAITESEFYSDAKAMDGRKKKAYWSTRREMFARLFESWSMDELVKRERENTYLVHGAKSEGEGYNTGVIVAVKQTRDFRDHPDVVAARDKAVAAEKKWRDALDKGAKKYAPKARPAMTWTGYSDAVYHKILRKHPEAMTTFAEFQVARRSANKISVKMAQDAGTRQAQPYPSGDDRKLLMDKIGGVVEALRSDGLLEKIMKAFLGGRMKLSTIIKAPSPEALLAGGWTECTLEESEEVWKGAGHKYVKRVPNPGGKGYRYFYKVSHGGGVAHEDHMTVGSAFQIAGGHYHVTATSGNMLTVKHDETGKTKRVNRGSLARMLEAHHHEAISAHKTRAEKEYAEAMKYGSAKQQAMMRKLAEAAGAKLPDGGRVDGGVKPPKKSKKEEDAAAKEKHGKSVDKHGNKAGAFHKKYRDSKPMSAEREHNFRMHEHHSAMANYHGKMMNVHDRGLDAALREKSRGHAAAAKSQAVEAKKKALAAKTKSQEEPVPTKRPKATTRPATARTKKLQEAWDIAQIEAKKNRPRPTTRKATPITSADIAKAGPFIGPRGGKWADAAHTIPWKGTQAASVASHKRKQERAKKRQAGGAVGGELDKVVTHISKFTDMVKSPQSTDQRLVLVPPPGRQLEQDTKDEADRIASKIERDFRGMHADPIQSGSKWGVVVKPAPPADPKLADQAKATFNAAAAAINAPPPDFSKHPSGEAGAATHQKYKKTLTEIRSELGHMLRQSRGPAGLKHLSDRKDRISFLAKEVKRMAQAPWMGKSGSAGDIAKAYVEKRGKKFVVVDGPNRRIIGSSASEAEANRILERHRAKTKKGGDMSDVMKGKTLPVGSIRTHGGKKMVKTAQGWKPHSEGGAGRHGKPGTKEHHQSKSDHHKERAHAMWAHAQTVEGDEKAGAMRSADLNWNKHREHHHRAQHHESMEKFHQAKTKPGGEHFAPKHKKDAESHKRQADKHKEEMGDPALRTARVEAHSQFQKYAKLSGAPGSSEQDKETTRTALGWLKAVSKPGYKLSDQARSEATKKGVDMKTELTTFADEVLYEDLVAKADNGLIELFEDVCKATELDMAVVDAKLRKSMSYRPEGYTDEQVVQRACDNVVCDLALGHYSEKGGAIIRAYVKEYGVDGLMARAKSLLAQMPKGDTDDKVHEGPPVAVPPHPSVLGIGSANGMPLG